jgi:hypothetical protein
MSLDKLPQLGSKPVNLNVRMPAARGKTEDALSSGLRDLWQRGEFVDVTLHCAGQTFTAHKAVLASRSSVLKDGLTGTSAQAAPGQRQEIRLSECANPEAVKFMLDYLYQTDASQWDDYNPRTQDINRDVLRLARQFQLPGLTERATYWLSKDLTTGNVVERLTICEDFELHDLREKILAQLTMNKAALSEVANSPQIMTYPKLMQALLQSAAAIPDDSPPPKVSASKARKAEQEAQAKKKGRKN